MISLTRLNGARFVLNADLIRVVEENPDTVITLLGGEHLVVKETMREVIARSIEFQRHTRSLTSAAELREAITAQHAATENQQPPPHRRHA